MNIENNERFKETEQKILNAYGNLAFSKTIDKIKVSDVCRAAGIHRTTFYGHFQDILDLESYISGLQFQRLINSYLTDKGWDLYEGILSMLRFYCHYSSMARKNFFNPTSFERLQRIFADNITAKFADSYKDKFHLKSDMEMTYHQIYLSSASAAIIKHWVMSGCRERPEEIAEIMCRLIDAV